MSVFKKLRTVTLTRGVSIQQEASPVYAMKDFKEMDNNAWVKLIFVK